MSGHFSHAVVIIRYWMFVMVLFITGIKLLAQDDDMSLVLISPADGFIIESVLPGFSWSPPAVSTEEENTSYQLKIVRVWAGQEVAEAMNENPPWVLEDKIYSNSHHFRIDASSMVIASPYNQFRPTVRELEARLFQKEDLLAEYAWQVSVHAGDGKLMGTPSEISTFNILTTHEIMGYPDIAFDIPSLTPLTMDLKSMYPLLQTDQEAVFDGFCIASPLNDEFKARFLDIGTYQPETIQFDAGLLMFTDVDNEKAGGFFTIEWVPNESLDIRWTWDEMEQSLSFPMVNLTMLSVNSDGPQLAVFAFTFLDIFEQPVYQSEFMVLIGCQ